MTGRTAAIIVIGNEILTGKTVDQNSRFLVEQLHGLGVALRRILVVPDDVEEIARSVSECAATFDYVFTSGGVGPTHDDVTIEGVARAFGRPIVRHPELAQMIRGHFGDRVDESRLRMADAPEGSQLIREGPTHWPVLALENVFILPGVPEILRRKFEAIRERFRCAPYHTTTVFTQEDEFDIAVRLREVALLHPDVEIGSYPNFLHPDYRVKITLEGSEPNSVRRALVALIERLDPAFIVRTE